MTVKQFRIDDIGASTKLYNQHGRKKFSCCGFPCFFFPLANLWFFKRIWPFRKWGPYGELSGEEWANFLKIFKAYGIRPVVAITAGWVEKNGEIVAFPEKFPDEAKTLKEACDRGDIVIANHGLTHCVVGQHRPYFWGSNQKYHREFWPWVAEATQWEHVVRSQEILEKFFDRKIEIFVPPGNIWSFSTYKALGQTNIKKVVCSLYMQDSQKPAEGIEYINDQKGWVNFHDRELKLYGPGWLKKIIAKNS